MNSKREWKISPKEYPTYLIKKRVEIEVHYGEIDSWFEPYRVVTTPYKYRQDKYRVYGIDEKGYFHRIVFRERKVSSS
jgi:hypothetical protein